VICFFLDVFIAPLKLAIAQPNLKFSHISYQQGLSQSPIGAIYQDKKGFIWIGNREGLIRYDGYEFITHSHKEGDENSLSHNLIRTIVQDSAGMLWIGTLNGLNFFNPAKKKFEYLDISNKKTVSALLIDRKQSLWVASYDGLKRIDIKDGYKLKIYHLGNGDLKNVKIVRSLLEDSKGQIWVGHENGLTCIDAQTLKIKSLPHALKGNSALLNATIMAIREDNAGDMWFATEDQGVFWYSIKEDICRNYRHGSNQGNGLLSDVIKDILVFDDENIWLGTRQGLSTFNKRTLTFTNYKHNSSDPKSLSQNSVWNFLRDKSDNIWLGTYAGGLNIFYPGYNNFENIGEKKGNNLGLSQPIVNDVLEEKDGALWVATDGGGINYIDRKKGKETYFPLKDNGGRDGSHIVKTMTKSKAGRLYLGTLEGLGYFDPADRIINYLPVGSDVPLEKRRINVLLSDENIIWVGTNHIGLWTVNTDNGTIKRFESDSKVLNNIAINSLAIDDEKGLWIGTRDGLSYYNKKTQVIKKLKRFNQEVILSLFIDSKKRFWVGTEKGLVLFDPTSGTKHLIRESDGLINNIIEAIIEDNSGNIWVSTQKGLSKISYKKNAAINNYTSNDGLSSNQFLPGAALKTKDGELLFGGVNGLTTFYPEKIIKNNYVPEIVFTDFLIHNKSVNYRSKDSPLKSPIDETQEIILDYHQNSISFKVAALNYVNSSNNRYAYKLEGFDKDEWYHSDYQRIANYTNLQAGTYVFRVKVSNNDNVWNEEGRSITVKVLPPFWKTWWAYIFYLFVFSALLYLFNSYSVKNERLKHELELESLSHIKDQELAQRKMTFFTNISHEIKTPLTMILAPIERLLNMSEGNNKIQNQLTLMHRNGERLVKLINQLLDFRKFDSGNDQLVAVHEDIVLFLKEIFLAFKGLAESKSIELNFNTELDPLNVWFDKDKLEKVFYNILSNAIKFAPYNGFVIVSIKQIVKNEKEHVSVIIEDNGCGIADEHINKIFEQFKFFNEGGLNLEGTGLGLAFSKELVDLHNGEISVESRQSKNNVPGYTAFTVLLPLGKEHLSEGEISDLFSAEENISQYNIEPVLTQSQFIGRKLEILKGIGKEKPSMLIVEDNPDVLGFIVSSFEDEFEIHTAVNGEEGLKTGQKIIPDIIISDVMMPVMDGISLCSKLKSDINTSHVPVILLTARSSLVFKLEGFETGADEYITKPFSINILGIRIWNLLDSRQKLRDRYQREIRLQPENVAITSTDDGFLKTLMSYIEKNIDKPNLTVDELSRETAVGRGTLYKKIKALTGQTVNDFVRMIRLKRAAQLLEQKNHNINEVAYMVGFADVNYFRKCFKEQFKYTPKEYSNLPK